MTTATYSKKSGRWTPIGIAAMVLGFYTWWPLGLAVIGYIMWGGSIDDLVDSAIASVKQAFAPARTASSGNAAFDTYKAETLERLEREQREFADYVRKLREARDSEEFKRFMDERKAK